MSKGLEKIVASLELCKLIPAGEFEDTALVWERRLRSEYTTQMDNPQYD